MEKNIKFEYSYPHAYCYIEQDGITFFGEATCHPDDEDYGNERTGLFIAEMRATLCVLRHQRDNVIKPQLKTLYHLIHNIQRSKYHNPRSHETTMILRTINNLRMQLDTVNNDIADTKKILKDYIQKKEEIYQKLRQAKNH